MLVQGNGDEFGRFVPNGRLWLWREEITREQFMNTIARIKANIDEMMINQVFNAIDTDLNGT